MATRVLFLIALLSTVVPLVPHAAASLGDCDSKGQPALGEVEIGDADPGATFYVDDRNYALGNGVWVYEESNGVYAGPENGGGPLNPAADLQRGGAGQIFLDNEEICTDDPTVAPDQLIF